jgi:KUP system potassium uptake protein
MNNDIDASHDRKTLTLTIAALGIVFGDIGTSPLYAVKEVFNPSHGIPLTAANLLGGISAVFWALMFVVCLKYVVLVMRADNKGEGGIMALLALAITSTRRRAGWAGPLIVLGLSGAALFYGDAVITPAISVLSAVEGLEVATPLLKPYVVPVTIAVLVVLFTVQRKGTSLVGALFGPVMILWFCVLALTGIVNIARQPAILTALDPRHAWHFLTVHGMASFVVLGAVFLAVTGAEALYADMGHFGKRAVRVAWFSLVFPALTLNYFGQGALVLGNPKAIDNPFYLAVPQWALYPMVVLATVATVIASQAVISGTYSITRQAIQLGFLPRAHVVHTSEREIGQIYIPVANWVLLAAVIAAVLGFGSSSNLASAYGLAVSGTMLITTILTFFVVRYCWHYKLTVAIAATALFAIVDVAFVGANLVKFMQGGWFPVAAGAIVFSIMMTWRTGRRVMLESMYKSPLKLGSFLASLLEHPPERVPGNAVFLVGDPTAVPHSLVHNLKHNKVLHARNVFLTVVIEDVPAVSPEERLEFEALGHDCYRIVLRFGFKEEPDVPRALALCTRHGLALDMMETSFFLSREKIVSTSRTGVRAWREHLFAAMMRNAGSIVDYFNIPANRVIELGTLVEI